MIKFNQYVLNWIASDLAAPTAQMNSAGGSIYIYKGTMPSVATGWINTSQTADLLATYSIASNAFVAVNNTVKFVTIPANVNASASGTAAWFGYRVPASTMVLFGDISVFGGTGSLQLQSTNLVNGSPVVMQDFGIKFLSS